MNIFKITGRILLERRKKDGTVIDSQEIKNTIVNTGKELVANLIGAIGSPDALAYIAIGEGSTGVQATDTTLETEVERESASVSYEASYKAIFEKTFDFGSGESYSITEVGLFDVVTESGSVMLNRATFSAKSVDVDIDLYVKVTITVA